MLIDLLREMGVGTYDPYAAYGDNDHHEDGILPPIDPVDDAAGCADVKQMAKSMAALGMKSVEAGISLLVHGLGQVIIAPIPPGKEITSADFLPSIEILLKKNGKGFAVLAEGRRERKIVFCPIFLVEKTNTTSRFIFDGRRLNDASARPPAVNLPNMEDLQRELERLGGSEPISWALLDLRHWFHQLKLPAELQGRIGVKVEVPGSVDGRTRARTLYLDYQTLPMGFSWSPYLAECCAWSTVLHREEAAQQMFDTDGLKEKDARLPRFVRTADGRGCVGIMYDNIILAVKGGTAPEMHRYANRFLKNCKKFNVMVKEASVFVPSEQNEEMLRYELVKDAKVVAPKRDRAGNVLPTDGQLPVVLGVEFHSSKEKILRWRHNQKRVDKAESMIKSQLQKKEWSARDVAHRVGLIVWDSIVRQRKFGRIRHVIEILKGLGVSKKADWDNKIPTPDAMWRDEVVAFLRGITTNEWTDMKQMSDSALRIFCASDASDLSLGGVIFDEGGLIQQPTLTASVCKSTHIYIKEVMAAHMTIDYILDSMFPQPSLTTRATIVICVDNTAAMRALQRGYSTNISANKLVLRMWTKAEARGVAIEVVDIASGFNVADCLTCDNEDRIREHGHALDGTCCGARAFRTFEVLKGRMPGRETSSTASHKISKLRLAEAEQADDDDDWMSRIETIANAM